MEQPEPSAIHALIQDARRWPCHIPGGMLVEGDDWKGELQIKLHYLIMKMSPRHKSFLDFIESQQQMHRLLGISVAVI